ncbi:hypothetical protein [Salisaeta longa]|uniref:hypothetical protein n=1 Tax=Salisaeta longa TaxID=503170 RepID=UPI00042729E8|nr:hypothetical protein [Salisaeta longa]
MPSHPTSTRDTMRGRLNQSRVKLWVLMNASRGWVAAAAVGLVVVVLLVGGAVAPASLASGDPVETLFQGLLTAIITAVSLVISINQVVLSQELGPLGDQQERMDKALSFRAEVADALDLAVSPPAPAAFLEALLRGIAARAKAVGKAANDALPADDAREALCTYSEDTAAHAEEVADQLSGAQFGTFAVVFAALNYNYSQKINEGRRLQAMDAVNGEAQGVEAALEAVVNLLTLFGPTREHIKTLYFQWELIDLSRFLLYTSIPALLVATCMILYADAGMTASLWTLAGLDGMVWVVALATAVTLLPFMVLLAYIVRIVTVAKHTLAMGPFVLRTKGSEGDD